MLYGNPVLSLLVETNKKHEKGGKKMSRTGSIYIIKNKCNDKVYIGQTTQSIEERFKQHLKPSQIKRCKYKLYRAFDKYGVENFYCESLEENVPYEKLDEREIYYIEKYDSFHNGYNSTAGGDEKTIYKIEDVEDIINRLQNGDLIKDIAEDYNVCRYTITRTLKAHGINSPSKVQNCSKKEYLRTLPREKIAKLYKDGLSHKEISEKLNINQRSVSRVVKELGIGIKNIIDYDSLDLDLILADFKKVESGEVKKKDVLRKYGLNQHSLKVIKKLKNIS